MNTNRSAVPQEHPDQDPDIELVLEDAGEVLRTYETVIHRLVLHKVLSPDLELCDRLA